MRTLLWRGVLSACILLVGTINVSHAQTYHEEKNTVEINPLELDRLNETFKTIRIARVSDDRERVEKQDAKETGTYGVSPGAESPQASDKKTEPNAQGFGAKLWDYLVNGASITVGIGLREAGMTVTRKSDGAHGKIVQRDEEAYFFSYSTRPSFIGESKFGYTFMFNLSTFNMDKQQIGKDVYENLGTRVKGNFAYVVPTIFYQWGEHRYKGKFIRLGIGFGLGATTFDGYIFLTENIPTRERVTISNKTYALKFAASVFWEARYRHWGIKLSVAGPNYEDETYKYSVSDLAVNLGYSYYF